MAASSQENCGVVDQSIPQWKRELILRRRALGRTLPAGNTSVKLTCPSVVTAVRHPELAAAGENVTGKQQRCTSSALASNKGVLDQTQADFHPRGRNGESSSVATSVAGNMRLVEHQVEGGTEFMINGVGLDITAEPSSAKYRSKMGEEKSLKKSATSTRAIVDNCIVKNRLVGENNNCHAAQDEEGDSDSSEELQYGPGIVNKLRCRYMSMTLRENQNKGLRPSLASMRRAASLENMLDNDSSETGKPQITSQHRFTKRTETANNKGDYAPQQQRYRPTSRSRNENVKRARSVETILRYEHAIADNADRKDLNKNNTNILKALGNDEIVIVENKMKVECSKKSAQEDKVPMYHQKKQRAANIPPETEMPPHDVVKQTLKIFEGSPSKKPTKLTRAPGVSLKPSPFKGGSTNVSKVNAAVASEVKSTPNVKPLLSPKPVLSPEKATTRAPSPRKQPAPLPADIHQKLLSPTLKKSLSLDISSPPAISPILSPTETNRRKSPSPTVPPRKIVSPTTFPKEETGSEPTSLSPTPLTNGKSTPQESTTEEEQEEEVSSETEDDADFAIKSVSRDALENIRKGGATFQFNFGASPPLNKPKSYLPNVRSQAPSGQQQISRTQKVTSPAAERQGLVLATKPAAVAPLPINKSPESPPQTQMKQVGVIRPIVSKSHPTSPPPPLTDREIEKNLINRVKSIEQPTSKVVVSLKPADNVVVGRVSIEPNRASVEESAKGLKEKVTLRSSSSSSASETKASGLWDKKKPWNQQQNTMVFNFSDRKDPIPDYIENDGLILRNRREKPKPGESGIIFPEGAADESSTDFDDDFGVGFGSPPSPCNVQFENDNILINGRSNLLKQPKQHKLRITFNDAATSTFEYPSEASLLSEVQAPAASPAAPGLPIPPPPSGPTPGVPVPLGGSSLASYTPSKVHLGSEDFQLGVTRATPLVTSPSSVEKAAPSSDTLSPEEEYLKPAEDGETVTWSSETAADLLF